MMKSSDLNYIKSYINKYFGFHNDFKDMNSKRLNDLAISILSELEETQLIDSKYAKDIIDEVVIETLKYGEDKIICDKYIKLDTKVSNLLLKYKDNKDFEDIYLEVKRNVIYLMLKRSNKDLDRSLLISENIISQTIDMVLAKIYLKSDERRNPQYVKSDVYENSELSKKMQYIRKIIEEEMIKNRLTRNENSLKNDSRVVIYLKEVSKNIDIEKMQVNDVLAGVYDNKIKEVFNNLLVSSKKEAVHHEKVIEHKNYNKIVKRRTIKDALNVRVMSGILSIVVLSSIVSGYVSKRSDKVEIDDLFAYNSLIYSVDSRNISNIIDSIIKFDSEEVGFENDKYSPVAIYKIYNLYHGDNRLQDMDKVIRNLATSAERMSEDGKYYDDICRSQCCLDYVCRILSSVDVIEYADYQKLIAEYVSNMNTNNPYQHMEKRFQNKIEKLMDEYKDYMDDLNNDLVDTLASSEGRSR